MIFRRFLQRLQQHQWGAIVTELVIVIIGVFIGIQVANWNDERKEQAKADLWRQQIIADLGQNLRDLERRFEYNRQALAFGEAALAALEGARAPSGDAVWGTVLGAFQAGQIWPYRLTGPSYREVQNAGGLALIGNEQAQARLAYLYDVSAHDFELVSGGLPQYRQMIRERMPWPIQNHIWDNDCQVGSDDDFELVHCAAPSDTALLRQTLDQLRADLDLQRALRGRLSQLKVSLASTGRLIERVKAAKESLQ